MGNCDTGRRDPGALLRSLAQALGVDLVPAEETESTAIRRPFVPVKLAAAWVGVSPRGFRKAIARGEVPAAKVGRSYVVLVDEWMERLRAQADDYAPAGGES